MDETVIKIEHLSKRYNINTNLQRTFVEEVSKRVKRIFQKKVNEKSSDSYELWALKDINLSVKKGETIGIIGPNGAGKTTLLKLISNITNPTEGKIIKKGKIASLIQIGTGFHGELTGKENVFLYGSIMGMTKKEIEDKYDDIMAFAELKRFADTPVKRYSSGMYVRLGFAVAVYTEPDILLVDEVLAVGDSSFQTRCMQKIGELKAKKVSILLVSHNMHIIGNFCDRVFYLNKGKIIAAGNPLEVIRRYENNMMDNEISLEQGKYKQDNKELVISKVEFFDLNNKKRNEFFSDEPLKVVISYNAKKDIINPNVSIGFYSYSGELLITNNTKMDNHHIELFKKGEGKIEIFYPFLPVSAQILYVSIALTDSSMHYFYDWHQKFYQLKIKNRKGLGGIIKLPAQWRIIGD